MKKGYLIIALLLSTVLVNAQNCQVVMPANTMVLQNDTTIVSQNGGTSLSQPYLPCKSFTLDSSVTVQNLIVLRAGTTFISDSLSTQYGGYFIYAKAGSTVDLNYKTALQLYYESGATLIDTNFQTTSTFCPNGILIDYSNMTASPNCIAPLSTSDYNVFESLKVFSNVNDWTVSLPESNTSSSWKLYSIDGSIVKSGTSKRNQFAVEKGELVPNIYILHINNEGSTKIIKLAKY